MITLNSHRDARIPWETTLLLTFLIVTVAVYWVGLRGGFIFDDLPNLVQSQAWKIRSFTPTEIARALGSDISGAIGRPLSMLSFAANHVWTGQEPFALKLTNLIMHLANGILVFLLCQRLSRLAPQADVLPARARLAPALVAGAWLVHPLQVSTVLYTVQRMEIGAATGVLGCLVAYLAARRRQNEGGSGLGLFGLAGLLLLFGLGFKESALVGLPLALLLEAIAHGFRDRTGRISKPLLALHAAWVVPAVLVYSLVVVPAAAEGRAYEYRDFDLIQRLLSQGPILVMYLGQIAWPLPDSLLFYYDHLRVPDGLFSPPWTAVSLSLLGLLGSLALLARRHSPLASLGVAWFFICHALTSNVIPLELAFEHRNYLATLGPLLIAWWALAWMTRRLHGDAALSIGLAPVLTLAGLCLVQTSTWADPFRLGVALASRNPDSPRANYALGLQLHAAAKDDTQSPQWSLARRQFEVAAQLPGASALPDQALVIMASAEEGGFPEERWEALERKLLSTPLDPDNVGAIHSVVACRLAKRCDFPDAAVSGLLRRVQEVNPDAFVLTIIRADYLWNAQGDQKAAVELLRSWRAGEPREYQVDLALAEFLVASNLHGNRVEAATLLGTLGERDLPPDVASRVRELRAALGGASEPLQAPKQ